MIKGINNLFKGCAVLWSDPPVINHCLYYERIDFFDERVEVIEGEALEYVVTYKTVRKIFGEKYRKGTSGRRQNMDFYHPIKFIYNEAEIREEDEILKYS